MGASTGHFESPEHLSGVFDGGGNHIAADFGASVSRGGADFGCAGVAAEAEILAGFEGHAQALQIHGNLDFNHAVALGRVEGQSVTAVQAATCQRRTNGKRRGRGGGIIRCGAEEEFHEIAPAVAIGVVVLTLLIHGQRGDEGIERITGQLFTLKKDKLRRVNAIIRAKAPAHPNAPGAGDGDIKDTAVKARASIEVEVAVAGRIETNESSGGLPSGTGDIASDINVTCGAFGKRTSDPNNPPSNGEWSDR